MKYIFQYLVVLSFIIFISIEGQTSLSGDIALNTTWAANNSPFTLSGDITLKNGAKLTIENGSMVHMNGNSISIGGENWGTPFNGILEASGVTFQAGKINFKQESSGTLTNCSFQNANIYFYDASNPSFSNNTLDAASFLHFKCANAFERMRDNNYGSQKIYLALDIGKNLTLRKIQNVDYYLEGEIKIGNGSKLEIENDVNIFLQNNSLSIGGENWGTPYDGLLEAAGANFYDGKIYFNQESGGALTHCSFKNTPIYFNDKTNPLFTNNILDASSILYFRSVNALERINDNTFGNSKVYIRLSVGKNFTLKRIPNVDYYLDGNIDIGNISKLTIESGITLYMQGNYIGVGGENWGTPYNGILDASGVIFNGGKLYFNQESNGTLTNCNFQNTPIYINNNSSVIISSSNIDIFSKIENKSSKNVNATNNYWGDPTGPKHSTNPGGYGTTISDKVDYIPFAIQEFDIITSIENRTEALPSTFLLMQNYPNPFNPATTISYFLPQATKVKLEVFDVTGRVIDILINREQSSGLFKVTFDGSQLSSGIYYFRLRTQTFFSVKKMLLLK